MMDGKALKNSHAFGCSCLYWPLRGLSGKCFCCGCGRAVVVVLTFGIFIAVLCSHTEEHESCTVPVLHRAEHLHGIAVLPLPYALLGRGRIVDPADLELLS